MTIEQKLNIYMKTRGMSLMFLTKQINETPDMKNVGYEEIRKSIRDKKRPLRAHELISLLTVMRIKLEDLDV